MVINPTKIVEKERAIRFFNKLIEGKDPFTLAKIMKKKTLDQNAYIWLVFTHIGAETGDDKNSMYKFFLDKFPKFETIEFNEEVRSVRISMSKFNLDQMRIFIDEVVTFLRVEGFDVPDPEDKKAIEMYNYYREKGMI